jgi:acyl-[acyl-carrier-protein]-phospholipid O-acyltransferase/long-chain-fatty-acid--[acyl-carrier-protein] ligase
VLLTVRELDPNDVRARLTEAGLPNLWIPRRVQKIDAVPVLSSGKVDLRGCEKLARKEA